MADHNHPKHTVSLQQFLLTGEWGPVKIGMEMKTVFAHLGEPDAQQDFGSGTIGTLYDWNEFFFDDRTLQLKAIQNDHLFPLPHPNPAILYQNNHFIVDTWFLHEQREWTRGQIIQKLQSLGIQFFPKTQIGYTVLAFESGAYFDFYSSEEKGGPPMPPEEDELIAFRLFPYF